MRRQKRGVRVEPDRAQIRMVVGGLIAGLLATVFLILQSGCALTRKDIDGIIDLIPTPAPQPTETPPPAPLPDSDPVPVENGKYSTEGSQRLLVKPASDNTGNLVILLPATWNNSFRNVWIMAGGKRYDDTGRRNINVNPDGSFPKNSNGNRRHIWFKQSGASIGKGVLIVELEGRVVRLERDFSQRSEKVEK